MPSEESTNRDFSHTVEVDNLQSKVWEYLIAVPRWPEWDTELKSARLFGPMGLHATGELVPKRGPKLKFKVTAYAPECAYTFETKLPVGSLVIERELAYRDGLTYFTDHIRFTGPAKRLFGWVLGSGFRAVLPEVMQHFKRLAEQR